MAKLHDTDTEHLYARIRELTEECRRLREELGTSTKERMAGNQMVNDVPLPPRKRRHTRSRPKKS